MRVQISLNFSSETAQLHGISVCYPEKSIELVSYRGAGLTGQTGSFPWSSAVQSLTILLLRSRLNWSIPHLSGGRGSAAAALEYAITKEPQWLVDLFGSDAAGRALIRRFVRRSNPNLKRPGPAELTVLPEVTVTVSQGGALVDDLETIRKLHDRLERAWHSYSTRGGRQLPEGGGAQSSCKPIEKLYFNEIGRALTELDIFDRQAVADRIDSIVRPPPPPQWG